jgi:hypothetical protein
VSDSEILRETSGEVAPVLKDAPWLIAVPSVLLAAGFAMDAWVSSLASVMPVLVSIIKGVGWAFYMRAAAKAAGGVEESSPVLPIATFSLAFLAMEYGSWFYLVGILVWLLPFVDIALVYGDDVGGAFGGIIDTMSRGALVWLGTMFAALIGLVLLGLVFAMPTVKARGSQTCRAAYSSGPSCTRSWCTARECSSR